MSRCRIASRSLPRALLVWMGSLAATAPLAAAGPVVFEPTGDFLLVVDGTEQPKAETFRASATAQMLVLSSALPSPVLLSPGTSSVETLQLMKVAKQPSGLINLFEGATLAGQGNFRLEGENVAFTADGHSALLKPRPPLLKSQTAAALLAYSPAYVRYAKAYQPEGATMKALRAGRKEPVKVQVFFGSWCPHCTVHVPRLMKVQEQLAGAPIQFEYYGLPRFPEFNKDPEAKRLGLNGVPTGVVLVGGREAGRITGGGWSNPEVTLKDILDAWSRK
jgi:thiol-disulfide isomerase/thioredoxin